ncbi:MAG: HIT domain-containing protein [Candidatus Zixiibacteriota bacterium]
MNCIFCDIINKTSPARIVFENERVIIFHDYRPQANIHLLICPKKHFATFMDAPNDEVAYLHKVCRKLAEYLKVENGFRMTINNGPKGGQIVYHLHVHFLSWIKELEEEKIELDLC